MIFPPCNNVSPTIASRLIIAPHWWCLLPSPPPLLHLSCYLFVSFGRLWRCQQRPFIFPITWRWYWKLMTQALYVTSKKCLGKIAAPRDNVSSRQRVCGCWLTRRPLPPAHFPRSDLLLFEASGLYTHMVLSWPAASGEPLSAVPYAEEDLAPNPQTQPSCQEVDGCGLKPLSPASFPAFFSSSTPCLAAQSWAWLYCRITHKKLLCLALSFAKWSFITWCWLAVIKMSCGFFKQMQWQFLSRCIMAATLSVARLSNLKASGWTCFKFVVPFVSI